MANGRILNFLRLLTDGVKYGGGAVFGLLLVSYYIGVGKKRFRIIWVQKSG